MFGLIQSSFTNTYMRCQLQQMSHDSIYTRSIVPHKYIYTYYTAFILFEIVSKISVVIYFCFTQGPSKKYFKRGDLAVKQEEEYLKKYKKNVLINKPKQVRHCYISDFMFTSRS